VGGLTVSAAGGLAFLDMDGTLLDCSSERMFLGHLARAGMIGPARLFRFAARYALHPRRTLAEGPGWNRGYLAGLEEGPIRSEASRFSREELVPRLRPDALSLAAELGSGGFEPVVISASLSWLGEPLAAAAGIPLSFSSVPEAVSGRLTGRLSGGRPWGGGKLGQALDICSGAGILPAGCAAAGDSWADRHLLEACGTAVAVHPDRRLRELARSRGWRIVG